MGCVYVRVGTEEGVPSAQLVKLNEQVVRNFAVETRDVRSSKRMAWDRKLQYHIDRPLDFRVNWIVVACPVSAEFLATHEETPSEHKGPYLIQVSLQ